MFLSLLRAQSEGKKDFVAMAVTTYVTRPSRTHDHLIIQRSPALALSDVPATISPCGICRQVLREFCHLDTPILLVPADYPEREKDEPAPTQGGVRVETVGGLLPLSFGPEDLERPRIPARADIEK